MLCLAELKKDRELISRIDWEMTPGEAFEAYQMKSPGNWRYGNLPDVYYFFVAVWKNQPKLKLIKRTYRDSEDIAEVPEAPPELVGRCLLEQDGKFYPRGQAALCDDLKEWLQKELGV